MVHVLANNIPTNIVDPAGGRFASLSQLMGASLNYITGIGWGIALVMLVVSLISLATSLGDRDRMQKAQSHLLYVVIGMFILFLVGAIRTIILNILVHNASISGI